jgi:hypothetical protein
MGLVAAGRPLGRWDERDRDRGSRRSHLDPATALAVGEVAALLESKLAEVELERPVLVGNRDEHGPNLADAGRAFGVGHFSPPNAGFPNETVGRARTHRRACQDCRVNYD